MMNSIKNIVVMAIFVLLQVIIFNNINFLGYANPYVYILFILTLPVLTNRYILLIYAFILGFAIDLFENTGGLNAFATVLIAFLKIPLIRIISNANTPEEVRLYNFSVLQWSIYLILLVTLHHFTVDIIESMQWSKIITTIERSLIGAAITLVLSVIYISSFPPKRQNEV